MGGGTLFYAERTGVALGPPDQGPPSWVLPQSYGAYVRALLDSASPKVHDIVYDGRPAWHVDLTTIPNAIVPEFSGDHLQLTVDKQSGIPVLIVESKHGIVLQTLRIEHLTVDPKLPAGEFQLAFPAGAEVMRSDDGFRRVPLRRVATTVGYRPLVPAWLPDGYRLTQVDVAGHAMATGKEGGNPPSRMVVSLSYRYGLDQLLITTRLRGAGSWSDPLASPAGFVDHPEHVTLTAGALTGTDALIVLSPRAIPHLWALTPKLVLTVSGNFDRHDLTRIANSLRRQP